MKITGISHLSINVDDRQEEARNFYNGLLGLPLVNHQRPQAFKDAIPGDWFALAEGRLHVFDYQEGGQWRTPGSPQPGGPHIAVYVEDLAAAVDELDEANIAYWSNGEGASRQIWILDPGGNTVELNQDPARSIPSGG